MDTSIPRQSPLLIGIADAAATLGLSRRSIERLLTLGRLPRRRLGRRVLIPAAAVRAFASRDLADIGPEGR